MKSAFVLGLALAACSSKESTKQDPPSSAPAAAAAPTKGVTGTWLTDGGATKLVLAPDGTFVMDTRKRQHVTGTYVLEGARLTMTGGGEGAISGTFSGTVKGSTIELQFGPKTSVFEHE